MIETQDLSKRYASEERYALRNATFSVGKGSMLGVLGYDGAGKSTLIRILATLTPPTSGHASIRGHDVVLERPLAQREFGYVPENPSFPRNTTLRKHLHFWANIDGLSPRERRDRVEELLEFLDLGEARDTSLIDLTTSDLQRMGLAQALLLDPPILLIDELMTPLLRGDKPEFREILKLLNKQGKTLLLTASHLEDVVDLCSDVLILHGGRASKAYQTGELLEAIGRFRHARVFVEAEEYTPRAIEVIRGIPGVVDVKVSETSLVVFIHPIRNPVEKIQDALKEEKLKVKRVKASEIPLGDVFRSLAGRGAS